MAETKQYIDLPDLALFKQLEDAEFGSALREGLATKPNRNEVGANGTALLFNESDGGGAKFEHSDGTMSFVGVNEGGENGLAGQLYVVKRDAVTEKNVGSRLNMTKNGFYYTHGKDSAAYTADDEIATKGDLSAISAADKTVWVTDNSAGQSDYAKVYKIWQGENAPDDPTNPATLLGTINIPLDKVLKDASVVDITYADGKLYDGATDVTALIKGETPATADDAGKYIKMEMQNVTDPLYVSVKDLVDVYTAAPNATQVQIAISNTNEISATLVDGGVTEAKLDASVIAKLGKADEVLGTAQDTSADITVYGTRAYAEELAGDATESVPEEDIRALFAGPSV